MRKRWIGKNHIEIRTERGTERDSELIGHFRSGRPSHRYVISFNNDDSLKITKDGNNFNVIKINMYTCNYTN